MVYFYFKTATKTEPLGRCGHSNELSVVKIMATGTGVSESGADVSLKPQVVGMLGPGHQVKRLLRVQWIAILALPTGTFLFLIYYSLTTVTTCPCCR